MSLHPSTKALLGRFVFDHLPDHLADVSRPFAELAWVVAHQGKGPEVAVALRKLLEAKDAAVRSVIPVPDQLVPVAPAALLDAWVEVGWEEKAPGVIALWVSPGFTDDHPTYQLLLAMGFEVQVEWAGAQP